MAITKKDIIDAAEQLISEGINPSMQAVRERLGSGSFATLSPVLREWKEARHATAIAVLEMPVDVKVALERFGADLWKASSSIATFQLEKIRDESRLSIEAANREYAESLEVIQELELQLAKLDSERLSIDAEIEEFKSVISVELQKNSALKQENDDLKDVVLSLKNDLKSSISERNHALEKVDALRCEQLELSRNNGLLTAKLEGLDKELVILSEKHKIEIDALKGIINSLSKEKD